MPVHFFASAVSSAVPTEYWASIAASLVAISLLKTWSKGTKLLDPPPARASSSTAPPAPTIEELFADLHGRVVVVASGAFTPLGVVTISALAHRGAQIIALTPDISSPDVIQIIHLIRDSTQSELVYAEQCDLASLESVSAFAALWNAGDKKQREGVRRLDALLFLPPTRAELDRVQLAPSHAQAEQRQNKTRTDAIYQLHVLARFHLVNSLLSSLLVLPRDREIRIVSVVSPYYAAGLTHFDVLTSGSAGAGGAAKTTKGKAKASPPNAHQQRGTLAVMAETSYSALVGAASLRWHALTVELQRRLDLLAEADPRPRTKLPGIEVQQAASTTRSFAAEHQKASQHMRQHSNITIINVCPGFERHTDILETLLPAPAQPTASIYQFVRSLLRWTLLLVIWPVVWLLTKSPATAADSIVWATTRKLESPTSRYHRILSSLSNTNKPTPDETQFRPWHHGLVPAELYREGRIVRPRLPPRFSEHDDAFAHLWKADEDEVERRIKALGGQIKRPKI